MRQRTAGVTLIELLIVVAVIGILAAIAYPSYRQYVLRASRTEAKVALLQWAQVLEKCFTRFGTYSDPQCQAATNVAAGSLSPEGRYRVTPVAPITAMGYVLQAAPQGGQAGDTQCGVFTLDQTGQRGVTGPGGVATCW